jgi:WD40 repeat protein
MSKLKNLLLVGLYFFVQGCQPLTVTQDSTFSLPTEFTQTPSISTQTPLPAIPSYTPLPKLISLENLDVINSSNISPMVNLIEIQSPNDYAISLYWDMDSKKILVLKNNATIEFWDIQNKSLIKTFESLNNNSYSIGWYPTKKLVAAVDKTTKEVTIWDLENKKNVFNLGMYTAYPFINSEGVSWSPDGSTIISTGWDNTLRVWDANTGVNIKVLESTSLSWYESVAWSPD